MDHPDERRGADGLVLESIASLVGLASARGFQDIIRSASPYGEAVTMQHLRNHLLASADGAGVGHEPEFVKRLDQALLRHFETPRSVEPAPTGGMRVLLLVDHLPARGRMFSHTRQICAYAAALALDPNVEAICILATQETAPENPLRGAGEVPSAEQAGWRAEIEEVGGGPAPKVRFFTPGRVGPVRAYRESISTALEFDPGIVFSHEGVFRSRLLPLLLRPHAAIVAVQMGQTNPEPPYADLVLAHGDANDFSRKPTPSKWRTHSVPLIPFAKEISIDPGELGPASRLRIVTVLTLGRLERGLMRNNAAGLRFAISFLEDHPEAVWLMVAVEDPAEFAQTIAPHVPLGVAGRLRLLPVVPDLRAIYEHSHIYMHLPPLGGGNMGVAMAIDEGVPALAGKGTDAANTLYPDQVYSNGAEAAMMLRRLAADPDLRSRWVARQQGKIRRDHSIRALSTTLGSLLPEARAAFKARGLAG